MSAAGQPRDRLSAETWTALNEEKRNLLTPDSDAPVEDLLRRGQKLSRQAAWLLKAVERGARSGSP